MNWFNIEELWSLRSDKSYSSPIPIGSVGVNIRSIDGRRFARVREGTAMTLNLSPDESPLPVAEHGLLIFFLLSS
jgi:hypothetical protein